MAEFQKGHPALPGCGRPPKPRIPKPQALLDRMVETITAPMTPEQLAQHDALEFAKGKVSRVVQLRAQGIDPQVYEREERMRLFVEAVGAGLTYGLAAKAAGISPSTWKFWRRYGEQEVEVDEETGDLLITGRYGQFLIDVAQAEGRLSMERIRRIQQIADEQDEWTAYAWLEERRHPEDFGRQIRENRNTGAQPAQTTIQFTFVNDWRNQAAVNRALEGEVIEGQLAPQKQIESATESDDGNAFDG